MMMCCSAPMSMPKMMRGGGDPTQSAGYALADSSCAETAVVMAAEIEVLCDQLEEDFSGIGVEPSAVDAPDPKKAEEDKLTTLIDLQSSDGHFRWDDAVAGYLGSTKAELMSKRADAAISDDIWITAVLIAMLESMAADKDLWELVVLKAKKFLAKTMNQDQVEKLLAAAASVLQSSS